jgi:hypothetical protein
MIHGRRHTGYGRSGALSGTLLGWRRKGAVGGGSARSGSRAELGALQGVEWHLSVVYQ